MSESVIPGTYITVRSEGLISAGQIATGIVGVLGTASSGPVGQPVTLGSYGDARDTFGLPDPMGSPVDGLHPLTLMRAIQLLYGNGATSVIAVRIAGAGSASATFTLRDKNGASVAVLTAVTPGTWGNQIAVTVAAADADCKIAGQTLTSGFDHLPYGSILASLQNRIVVTRGATHQTNNLQIIYKIVVTNESVMPASGKFNLSKTPIEQVAAISAIVIRDASGATVRTYSGGAILYGAGGPPALNQIRIATDSGALTFEATQVPTATQTVIATYAVGNAPPSTGQVLVTTWDGSLVFAAGEAPQAANGDTLIASYQIDRAACVKVSIATDTAAETYTVPDGRLLAQQIQSSGIAAAVADPANGANMLAPLVKTYFGTGANTPGNDGADADADAYANGLASIENETVNIVVLAGQDSDALGSTLLDHLNATAETDLERIGVIGAPGAILANGYNFDVQGNDRIVVVAPGILDTDGTTVLASGYSAAAVAGVISSLPVQGSLTNQVVNVAGLATKFNRGQQEQLINLNIAVLADKEGFRVVKGVTASGIGTAFSAVPTRRIVDYAKYGVRSGANSYLGRLNNDRVRAALKATLDAFLTRMVLDEALTGYELEVAATRAQEIAGEVTVSMTLQPTFSIEYILVTMILK